jgi:ribonucleoside-diphosphate reductase alpha chain
MQQNVGCGPLYVTVNEDEFGRPFEVFFKLAKSGSCQQSYLEALGIVVSLSLRYGAEPQKIIEKLSGIRCPNPKMRVGPDPAALSCADGISQAIGRALELALIDGPASIAHEAPAPVAVAEPQPVLDLIGALGVATAQSGRNGASSHTNGKRTMLDGTGLCPTCHGLLIRIEGCERCMDCGHSGKCS